MVVLALFRDGPRPFLRLVWSPGGGLRGKATGFSCHFQGQTTDGNKVGVGLLKLESIKNVFLLAATTVSNVNLLNLG